MVAAYHATAHRAPDPVEQTHIPHMLHHGEFREDLGAEAHLRMPAQADMETPFAIHKSHQPIRIHSVA
jgi:hypothetical protein